MRRTTRPLSALVVALIVVGSIAQLGLLAVGASFTVALAATVAKPMAKVAPTDSRLPPSATPSRDPAPVPKAPAGDLTFAAGGDLPNGLSVFVASSFPGDEAWRGDDAGPVGIAKYVHLTTGCAVRYASMRDEPSSADDEVATRYAIAHALGEDLSGIRPIPAKFVYDAADRFGLEAGDASPPTIDFLSYVGTNPQGHVVTAGRALTATKTFIMVEVMCPEHDDVEVVWPLIQGNLTFGLYPGELGGLSR